MSAHGGDESHTETGVDLAPEIVHVNVYHIGGFARIFKNGG